MTRNLNIHINNTNIIIPRNFKLKKQKLPELIIIEFGTLLREKERMKLNKLGKPERINRSQVIHRDT